jgi:hypothetical protein
LASNWHDESHDCLKDNRNDYGVPAYGLRGIRNACAVGVHTTRGLICHVCSSSPQCKDETREYTGIERHGNADTPELKSAPLWLEEKLAKTA